MTATTGARQETAGPDARADEDVRGHAAPPDGGRKAAEGARSNHRAGLVTAVRDQRPTVRITSPGRDLSVEALGTVRLAALASDDYGLTDLALEVPPLGRGGAGSACRWGAEGKRQRVDYEWDLAALALSPGQSLSYRFAARDNNAVRGPAVGYSQTFQVTLADRSPREAQKRLEEARETQGEALERLRQQAKEIQEELAALSERMQQGELKELTPGERAELQQAAQQLQKQAETLQEALARAEQEVKQSGAALPELARKMAELNRLLSEDGQQATDPGDPEAAGGRARQAAGAASAESAAGRGGPAAVAAATGSVAGALAAGEARGVAGDPATGDREAGKPPAGADRAARAVGGPPPAGRGAAGPGA